MDAFIGDVLGRLVATSVQTVLLTAVVWSLCRCLPRLSPAAQCWLWWLVALQALAGLLVDPVELPWLPRAAALPAVPSTHWKTIPLDSGAMQPVAGYTGSLWSAAAFLFWVGGVAVMGWSSLRHWRRVRALLKASTHCVDAHLLQSLAHASESRGLRRAPRLRLSQSIDSPLLVGHLHPVLLLPARTALNSEELDMALAHELTHLRRGDLWWGCVPALARHLFFFHPFAHLAVREYGIAREADCDAAVMQLDRHSSRDYGRLLLRLGTCADSGTGLAVASPTFHALNRRLTMLQNTRFLPRAGSIALLIIVAAVGVMPLRLVAAAATPVPRATAATPTPAAPRASSAPAAASAAPAPAPAGRGIKSIDFRRTSAGSATGDVIVKLDDPHTPVNVRQEGNRVLVDFLGADLPANLQQRYDVAAFATPVTSFEAMRTSGGSQLAILVAGDFEQRAHQSGDLYVVEIQPRGPARAQVDDETLRRQETEFTQRMQVIEARQAEAGQTIAPQANQVEAVGSPGPVYTGERMTVNFQDISTRALLKLLGDTSGRNIVIDDAVTGSVTIRLNNAPWDEVLDIVLRTKGLEKRVQGDVIFIAPSRVQAAPANGAPPAPRAQ